LGIRFGIRRIRLRAGLVPARAERPCLHSIRGL